MPLLGLSLVVMACGGDDDDGGAKQGTATTADAKNTSTGLLPCSEDHHLVAFDLLGPLVPNDAAGTWLSGGTAPAPVPGTPELVNGYRQRGFEILYISTLTTESTIPGGMPLTDAINQWLQAAGFPVGDGTHVWTWDGVMGQEESWPDITDELMRFAGEGYTVDAGYTENGDKAYAMATAGVPMESLFSFESEPITDTPTTPIPGDDFVSHAQAMQDQAPVCQAG